MGMLYRKDIFDKYNVKVPTTWEEFAQAAQQLKDAGFKGVITDFPTNGRAFNTALFAQAGWKPFTYDIAKPDRHRAGRVHSCRRQGAVSTGTAW